MQHIFGHMPGILGSFLVVSIPGLGKKELLAHRDTLLSVCSKLALRNGGLQHAGAGAMHLR